MENALVHPVGDVATLTRHITMMHEDRAFLEKLRAASIRSLSEITWQAAGKKLLGIYRDLVAQKKKGAA
jgi:hypothetical protein